MDNPEISLYYPEITQGLTKDQYYSLIRDCHRQNDLLDFYTFTLT